MTLLNVCGLSHHYAHGGFSGKHQHQAVLNNVSLTLKRRTSPCWDAAAAEKAPSRGCW
ncbi:hypothetical protein ACVXG9_11660 [Escherichia coli]